MTGLIRFIKAALIWAVVIAAPAANANFGLHLGAGKGTQSINAYRGGISWDFGPIWCEKCTWGLVGIWESSFAFWNGNPGPNDGYDKLYLFGTSPVLRWHLLKGNKFKILPYFEGGIGFSWLSRHTIGGRRLSTHFQFEDKVGLGMRFGDNYQFDATLRLVHHSNASIKRPNSGINLCMFQLALWFN